ncbi:TPA: acetyl-CoA C-acyltransferase [Klebsiella pneumoniae]|nr:acetyl-CoA C-acyltransferase [Klebsiella pneumoniae]
MTDIAIVAAVRTPVGSFRGAFAPLSAVDLGAAVVRGLLERCQLPAAAVDELIFGQVLTAGCGQNPARQTALRAGLPVDTPAVTVNLVCGSGLKAVQQAVQAIRCGDAGIVIAGGQESMSNAPYLMHGARDGLRFGHASLQDSMIQDGLWDAFNDYHMGITAENLADAFDISRERQDAFAASSQRKAAAAIAAGRFREEIVPVSVPQGKKPPRVVTDDEQPRPETSEQQLAQLRPAFRPADGSVTAGNASSLNDGAAAVLLMRVDKARELGLPVLARQVSDFCAACALEAVVLNRAAPGFVGNRLQFALLREALHIVHSGIASPEVVDQVMRASLGRRYAMVGPLEAADMTGLATVQDICQHLLPELASGTEMMSLVAEKVARGDTGARSGQGFYRWDEARHQRIQSRREHQLRFALKP